MQQDSHLEERIRHLCAQLLTAKEPEFTQMVEELRGVLHEHLTGVREITRATLKRLKAQLESRSA